MYLLKSWRDARLSVAIFFVPIVFMLYGFCGMGRRTL